MIDANTELSLTVTAAELNVIMTALAEAPYRLSAPVIAKVQQQVEAAVPGAFAVPGAMPSMNGDARRE